MRNKYKILVWCAVVFNSTIFLFGWDKPDIILTEWPISIQILPLDNFLSWPGMTQGRMIDVAINEDRLSLIWTSGIVSLNSFAEADVLTLLALFSTSQSWKPDNGVITSSGHWVAMHHKGLIRRNIFHGNSTTISVPGIQGGRIHAAMNGSVIIQQSESTMRIRPDGSSHTIVHIPPVASTVAISTTEEQLAWQDGSTGALHITQYQKYPPKPTILFSDILRTGSIWNMVWVEKYLVVGFSGALAVFNPESNAVRHVSHPVIPRQWYRLRGSGNGLAFFAPSYNELVHVRIDEADNTGIQRLESLDFSELLEKFALAAGELMEAESDLHTAEAYYGWVLPLVRQERSRNPINPLWAEMEEQVIHRRASLRASF